MTNITGKVRTAAGALGAAVVLTISAQAAGAQQYAAQLTGAQQVPAVSTPGFGMAMITLSGTSVLNVNVMFANLTSGTLFAHIHAPAPVGANAPVALPFIGFPVGVTAGAYNASLNLDVASTYEPAFLTANGGSVAAARTAVINAMNGGLAYVNVHTANFPGGEIRGQVGVVPEPSTYALLATGVAGLGLVARRRRQGA